MTPCPTCGQTLSFIGTDYNPTLRAFHCGQCGTVATFAADGIQVNVYRPLLVKRCREFQEWLIYEDGPGMEDSEAAKKWREMAMKDYIQLPIRDVDNLAGWPRVK